MMDIAFVIFNAQTIQSLLVADGAESRDIEHLGLPAGEQGGTVNPRQNAHFTGDRPDFIQLTAVRANFVHGNHPADSFLQDFI